MLMRIHTREKSPSPHKKDNLICIKSYLNERDLLFKPQENECARKQRTVFYFF